MNVLVMFSFIMYEIGVYIFIINKGFVSFSNRKYFEEQVIDIFFHADIPDKNRL